MNTRNFRELKQKEVDDNFHYFETLLAEGKIPPEKYGMYALIRNKEIMGYYATWLDAEQAGILAYTDRIFSIQEVNTHSVNLGFYSYAIL